MLPSSVEWLSLSLTSSATWAWPPNWTSTQTCWRLPLKPDLLSESVSNSLSAEAAELKHTSSAHLLVGLADKSASSGG